jgi:hypothetical protein
MPDVVDDDFVLSDFIHDQIVTDWKATESRFPRRLAEVGSLGDLRRHLFDAGDEMRCCFSIMLRYVRKNLVEIGESATFVPKLHALR